MNQIYSVNYAPQTREETEEATTLSCRSIEADDERSFLRCQIGFFEPVRRSAPVYVLHAHGATWPEAYKMWRKRKINALSNGARA